MRDLGIIMGDTTTGDEGAAGGVFVELSESPDSENRREGCTPTGLGFSKPASAGSSAYASSTGVATSPLQEQHHGNFPAPRGAFPNITHTTTDIKIRFKNIILTFNIFSKPTKPKTRNFFWCTLSFFTKPNLALSLKSRKLHSRNKSHSETHKNGPITNQYAALKKRVFCAFNYCHDSY
jgi:hypothetical protein